MAIKTNRNSVLAVMARDRERKALELRTRGFSYSAIAQRLGLSVSGAFRTVDRTIQRTSARIKESAEHLVQLELARLDELWMAVWPKARRGNLSAIDRALRIMERRSKYLWLDQPSRIEGDFFVDDGEKIDAQLRDLVQKLRHGDEPEAPTVIH